MSEDALYSRLNARGRKSFKPTSREQLAEKFPDYGKVGLPAHKAAIEGNVEALKEVFCAYADEGVPSRDLNGATPLHLAVRGNRLEAVKWLLRFTDLSPTTSAKHGETPCHVAAVLGHTDCLKAMLGADVKGQICMATDNSGFTALHLAIVKSRNEVSKMLINELGAKGVGAVNESGITAAHVAASSGNVEVLKLIASKHKKLLSQEAADGTTPLYFAAQEGRLGTLKFLHEKGKCDLSYPSSDGRKPIHAACQCGHTHVVKYIVSQLNNSAIFETSPDGATPLHFATSTGMVKTARWLINSDIGGTLVKMKDSNGDTAAHDAADNGQIETLKLLLESGADLYAINNDGNTPYSLALSGQYPEMANFVMTYASNAPQKQDEGPSQMTIFDMQGEVDVVNFGSGVTGPPKKPGEETVEVTVEVEKKESPKGSKADEKKKSKKKKEKEKKEKEKKEKGKKKSSSSSFMGATGAALLSLPPGNMEKEKDDRDDKALDMTAEEMEMFKEQPRSDDEPNKAPPSTDGSDIVVSYGSGAGDEGDVTPPVKSKLTHQPGSETAVTTDYSTVAQLAMVEEKKKKKGRQSSKSIQKSLKPEEQSAKNLEGAGAVLSGPELGFKPQFRSNPLHNLAPQAPPTPPPTPATGISSSAPSDAGLVSTEDEDDTPYDVYTKPEQEEGGEKSEGSEEGEGESRETKQEKQEGDSQLEENIVTDLDADQSSGEKDEGEKEKEEEEEEEEEEEHEEGEKGLTEKERHEPSVLKKWPPSASEDYKPSDVKVQPSGANVLKKWPPSSASSTSPPPAHGRTVGGKAQNGITKKWPPTSPSEPKPSKPQPVSHPPPPPITKQPSPPTLKVTEDEAPKKLPIQLRSVHKTAQPSQMREEKRELDKIKLKKTTKGGAHYSSPSTEATSGAGSELTALLKVRQQKI